jgi:hypothetical protein
LGGVDLVVAGEGGGERGVVEVPHEGRGVEEVDGGDAQAGWSGVGQEISLCAAREGGVVFAKLKSKNRQRRNT